MSIQTVIRHRFRSSCNDDWEEAIHYLEESPEEVRASIDYEAVDDTYEMRREVYSLEKYLQQKSITPLSDFCPPAPKKGIWWLTVDYDAVWCLVCRTNLGVSNHQKVMMSKLLVKHFHVTLTYDVTEDDKPEVSLTSNCLDGEFLPRIKVRGLAYNDKCACLVIDFIGYTLCCNKHPHITLATAESISPVYSNDMLAGKDGAYQFLPLEAELEGSLEFFEFN